MRAGFAQNTLVGITELIGNRLLPLWEVIRAEGPLRTHISTSSAQMDNCIDFLAHYGKCVAGGEVIFWPGGNSASKILDFLERLITVGAGHYTHSISFHFNARCRHHEYFSALSSCPTIVQL